MNSCREKFIWVNDSLHCHPMSNYRRLSREAWWLKGNTGREDFKRSRSWNEKKFAGEQDTTQDIHWDLSQRTCPSVCNHSLHSAHLSHTV